MGFVPMKFSSDDASVPEPYFGFFLYLARNWDRRKIILLEINVTPSGSRLLITLDVTHNESYPGI